MKIYITNAVISEDQRLKLREVRGAWQLQWVLLIQVIINKCNRLKILENLECTQVKGGEGSSNHLERKKLMKEKENNP